MFAVAVCICVLGFGCAGARTSAGSDAATDDRRRPETQVEKSYAPPTVMTSPEPPGSTLSYGGDKVEAAIGTYCWFAGGSGACVDGAMIVDAGANSFGDKLVVRSGAAMSFVYKGKKLDSLGTAAHKVGRKGTGNGRMDGGQGSLKTRLSGTRARIFADLPPGEYVLDAFATMPEGDVSYSFGLVVKAR